MQHAHTLFNGGGLVTVWHSCWQVWFPQLKTRPQIWPQEYPFASEHFIWDVYHADKTTTHNYWNAHNVYSDTYCNTTRSLTSCSPKHILVKRGDKEAHVSGDHICKTAQPYIPSQEEEPSSEFYLLTFLCRLRVENVVTMVTNGQLPKTTEVLLCD